MPSRKQNEIARLQSFQNFGVAVGQQADAYGAVLRGLARGVGEAHGG
jgi:hypothetical protein